jgi:hypothetical protein
VDDSSSREVSLLCFIVSLSRLTQLLKPSKRDPLVVNILVLGDRRAPSHKNLDGILAQHCQAGSQSLRRFLCWHCQPPHLSRTSDERHRRIPRPPRESCNDIRKCTNTPLSLPYSDPLTFYLRCRTLIKPFNALAKDNQSSRCWSCGEPRTGEHSVSTVIPLEATRRP